MPTNLHRPLQAPALKLHQQVWRARKRTDRPCHSVPADPARNSLLAQCRDLAAVVGAYMRLPDWDLAELPYHELVQWRKRATTMLHRYATARNTGPRAHPMPAADANLPNQAVAYQVVTGRRVTDLQQPRPSQLRRADRPFLVTTRPRYETDSDRQRVSLPPATADPLCTGHRIVIDCRKPCSVTDAQDFAADHGGVTLEEYEVHMPGGIRPHVSRRTTCNDAARTAPRARAIPVTLTRPRTSHSCPASSTPAAGRASGKAPQLAYAPTHHLTQRLPRRRLAGHHAAMAAAGKIQSCPIQSNLRYSSKQPSPLRWVGFSSVQSRVALSVEENCELKFTARERY